MMKKMIEKNEKERIDFPAVYEKALENSGEKSAAKSLKEAELEFYNELMIKISYDSANFATFREIGIEEYQKFSSKLMTLIHERREKVLEKDAAMDVDEGIKNQIAYYSNNFYYAIKENCMVDKVEDPQKLLMSLLKTFHDKLEVYEDLEMLHRNVQYFLLLLLQLYRFENKDVTIGFIKAMIDQEKGKKMTLESLDKIKKASFPSEPK